MSGYRKPPGDGQTPVQVKCLTCKGVVSHNLGNGNKLIQWFCSGCNAQRGPAEFVVDAPAPGVHPVAALGAVEAPLSLGEPTHSFCRQTYTLIDYALPREIVGRASERRYPMVDPKALGSDPPPTRAERGDAAVKRSRLAARVKEAADIAVKEEADRKAVQTHIAQIQSKIDDAYRALGGGPIPHINGSVIGYRAWKLSPGFELQGTGMHGVWPHSLAPYKAVCVKHRLAPNALGEMRQSHEAPEEACDCGVYALSRFTNRCQWWDSGASDIICGAIEAWAEPTDDLQDRFFLQGQGFRAQYAKVVLLALRPEWSRPKRALMRAVAKEYGADVCDFEHLEAAASEHGQLVPDELLDWGAHPDRQWSGAMVAPSDAMMEVAEKAREAQEAIGDFLDAWERGLLSAAQARKLMGLGG